MLPVVLSCLVLQTAPIPDWTEAEVQRRIQIVFRPEQRKDVKIHRSEHYIVFSQAELATNFMQRFEMKVYHGVRVVLGFRNSDAPRKRMPVYLFKTKDDYVEYCVRNEGFSESQAKETGGIANEDYFATFMSDGLREAIYHEGAHQIFRNVMNHKFRLSWLEEGIAEYCERKLFREGLFQDMQNAILEDKYLPLNTLFSTRSLGFSKAGIFKGVGWREKYLQVSSIVEFLKTKYSQEQFDAFLSTLDFPQEDADPLKETERALDSAYHLTIAGLEREWKQHFLQGAKPKKPANAGLGLGALETPPPKN